MTDDPSADDELLVAGASARAEFERRQKSSNHQEVFARERQQHIALSVEEHGRVRVTDLAERFAVS